MPTCRYDHHIVKMSGMLLLLSLCVVPVIQLTSSQPTYDVSQQENDVNSCSRMDHYPSQLMMDVSQLVTAVSEMQQVLSQLQSDVAELKNNVRRNIEAG